MRVIRKSVLVAVIVATVVALMGVGGARAASGPPKTLKASAFTSDFSAMKQLRPLAKPGKGMSGVLLPETTTSARYTAFDAPYLQKAFQKAGLSSSQYKILNAQGNTATQKTQAEALMTQGATVLLVDP